ncbi:MAG TPA: molybdopterin-dependent oxidoreductase [Fimbriiglobus sp.]|jgi:NADH-quinone oxidoreductase subunit G|nr:molybdopterin-dependent oxidoreductase [Fimbriiglobus sp.]
MPTVYVNDKPVEIGSQRLNCVQAAELAGVLVPHYCYHPELTVVASCRMCLIEMGELKDGKVTMVPKVFPGCQTPVKDGTVIITGEYDKRDESVAALPYDANYKPGDRAKKSQADTLEGILLNHPLDCPVCDKAGECKLQDFSYQFGRSESRMVDPKNTPPNKPDISSTITLFTDRCIMCTRCVRFTREVSGTAELTVTSRGHHSEIDVFPGRPLENKLAGNVVDLCPVGALGSKDFLYTQRVWYLKDTDGVCSLCSTGCSVHVDHNKDIVYRLRPRVNPDAQGYFMCDEGRYGYHFVNSGERIVRPTMAGQRATWHDLLPKLKADLAAASGLVGVLSPFLTVEEAYLYATALKAISPDAKLVLGPVPVVGEDDKYPKDVRGNPVEPTRFTIRAEKCPNRRGVEAVLKHFEGHVVPVEEAPRTEAVFFAGGYPNAEWTVPAVGASGKPPVLLVVQHLFPSPLTEAAKYVLPATAGYEKDGTYVNHAGLAQSFGRAVRPPTEVRGELQIAYDLLGRKGLAQAATIRKELAGVVAEFAGLTDVPRTGTKIELQTV